MNAEMKKVCSVMNEVGKFKFHWQNEQYLLANGASTPESVKKAEEEMLAAVKVARDVFKEALLDIQWDPTYK